MTSTTTSSKRVCSSRELSRRCRCRKMTGDLSSAASVFIGPTLEDRTMHQPLRFTPRVAMPVELTLPVFVTTALMWGANEPFEDQRSKLWRTRIALGLEDPNCTWLSTIIL